MEQFYYVYVLVPLKEGKKYVGYTSDLLSRFEAHQKGKVSSTKHRRAPLELINFEACLNQQDALKERNT